MRQTGSRPRLLAALIAASLALTGCGNITNTVSGWFTTAKRSNLRGERISLNATDETLQPDPALAAVQVQLPPPYRNPEWPQAGGYPTNAMYHLEAPGRLTELWTADGGTGTDSESALTATPVVGAGRIFTLDSRARVRAFSAANGQRVWERPLAPPDGSTWPTLWGLLGKANTVVPAKGMGGGIAFHDGKIYVTSGLGQVVAMEAATGRVLWTRNLGLPIFNAPVVNGGRIFVSTHNNHFYALAEADGRQLWDHRGISETAGLLSGTSAAVAGEFVIAPFTSGEISAFRVQNGQMAWSDILSRNRQVSALSDINDIAGRPVIGRGQVYAIGQGGVMVALNLATGERLWERNIGGFQTPWAAGDYVYVVTNDAMLLCLTRKDGKIRWRHQLPQYEDPDNLADPIQWAGPVLVSNRLILTSSNGYAQALSPYTGALLGRVEIPAGTVIAPIVADGTIYLYTSEAELVALR